MTKAIIFDLGGVVLNPEGFTLNMLTKIFGVSPKQIQIVYTEVLEKEWGRGEVTAAQIVEKIKQKFPINRKTEQVVKEWQQIYLNQTKIDQEILNRVDKLHKNYRVYLLTNTVDIHSQVNKKRGIYSHFDNIYESCALGIRKPNKEIYQYVLRDLSLKPQECFFTDDRQVHIDGAKALGIDAAIFESQDQLEQELLNRGVSL